MSGAVVELTRNQLHELAQDHRGKLARAEAAVEAIKADLAVRLTDVTAAVQRHRSALGEVENEIRRREARDSITPAISDHALLRYIERVHGVDVDALKAELLTTNLVAAIKGGASWLKTDAGTFVIQGAVVVTFLAPEMRAKRRTRRGLVEKDFTFDLVTDEGDEPEELPSEPAEA